MGQLRDIRAASVRVRPSIGRCACAFFVLSILLSFRATSAQESQPSAPPEFAEAAQSLDTLIPWITDGLVLKDPDQSARRRRGEPDRDALMTKALAIAKEKNRLVLWYVPRILSRKNEGGDEHGMMMPGGTHMYRPAIPHQYMREVFWSDPEIAALVNAKFVAISAAADEKIGPKYGIQALEYVEPAIVLLSPDGKVVAAVDRIRTFNADWLSTWLRRSAEKSGEFGRPIDPAPAEGLAAAKQSIDAGDFAKALEVLAPLAKETDKKTAFRALYLSAIIHRRNADKNTATTSLAKAKDLVTNPEDEGDWAVESARVALCDHRRADAEKFLERFRGETIAHERRDEGRYLLGATLLQRGEEDAGRAVLALLAKESPKSPFAARGALAFTPGNDTTMTGALRHNFENFAWQKAETYTADGRSTHGLLAGKDALERARLASRWLLDHQAKNGSWNDARYAYWDTPKIIPNVWMAVTALSASALLDWQMLDSDEIAKAVDAAEPFIMDDSLLAVGRNEQSYAQAYRLLYLAKRTRKTTDPVAKAAYKKKMDEISESLEKMQVKSGAWAHEYPNPFTTGAIMQCLADAKAAGARVSDVMMQNAAKSLLSVRDEKTGSFQYGTPDRPAKNQRGTDPKDAMARMPVCEGALVLTQKSDLTKLDAAFKNWWNYADRFERIRKCDFHSDGELGGFFYWHAIYHGTVATQFLESKERRINAGKFLETIMRLQEMDGSFLDSHELGKSYGTAMALLALKNCLGEE